MAKSTTVYLVRHGDVENPDQVYYGRLPGFPLSEYGREQAKATGESLRERPIVAIYTSPQLRARETARIIQEAVDAPRGLIEEPLLNEVRSQFDGAAHSVLEKRAWNFYDEATDEFEQPVDVLSRMKRFLQRVRTEHDGQEIVAVSHADPIVFVWMWVLGIPLKAGNRRLLDTFGLADDYPAKASISTFYFSSRDEDERPVYHYQRPY